jgi:hypothetical protein
LLEPFPTLYWLTHPFLRTLTSKLELGDSHNATILEKRLLVDPVALESMERAHASYGKERWELLTKTDKELLVSRNWQGAVGTDKGISGIRKPFAIKCLHAHLAHYLSEGEGSEDNVIGKWVLDELCRLAEEHRQKGLIQR